MDQEEDGLTTHVVMDDIKPDDRGYARAKLLATYQEQTRHVHPTDIVAEAYLMLAVDDGKTLKSLSMGKAYGVAYLMSEALRLQLGRYGEGPLLDVVQQVSDTLLSMMTAESEMDDA